MGRQEEIGFMQIWLSGPLVRHYPTSGPKRKSRLTLHVARGESASFQAAYRTGPKTQDVSASVAAEDGIEVQVRQVGYVPMRHHNTDTPPEELDGFGRLPGYVPDPLLPEPTARAGPYETGAFWLTVRVPVEAKPGRSAVSSTIGTFGTISRMEFGASRRIMELEYEAMRCFTKVHLFKLRVFAPPCPICVDPDTEQAVGCATCLNCYGTQKDKGYADPVVTYMRIMTISPTVQASSADGTGSTDPSVQVARLLAFPLLRKGDMLVHKEADRRYLVNDVDYSYMGGKVPVIAMANLSLLQSKDVRYKLLLS